MSERRKSSFSGKTPDQKKDKLFRNLILEITKELKNTVDNLLKKHEKNPTRKQALEALNNTLLTLIPVKMAEVNFRDPNLIQKHFESVAKLITKEANKTNNIINAKSGAIRKVGHFFAWLLVGKGANSPEDDILVPIENSIERGAILCNKYVEDLCKIDTEPDTNKKSPDKKPKSNVTNTASSRQQTPSSKQQQAPGPKQQPPYPAQPLPQREAQSTKTQPTSTGCCGRKKK